MPSLIDASLAQRSHALVILVDMVDYQFATVAELAQARVVRKVMFGACRLLLANCPAVIGFVLSALK